MSVTLRLEEIWSSKYYSLKVGGSLSIPDPKLNSIEEEKDFIENVYPAFAANTINAILGTGLLNNPFPSIDGHKDVAALKSDDDTSESIFLDL